MEHHAGRVEVAWVVKMYRKLFFFQIFIAHEIINFQLLLTYKILKVFFLLLLGVCRYPSRRPHPLPCTYRQIYTHTHRNRGESCAAACTEGINTRFAKKLRRTKKKSAPACSLQKAFRIKKDCMTPWQWLCREGEGCPE